MNQRQLGSMYEERATEYLKAKGYRILERNFRNGSAVAGGQMNDIVVQRGIPARLVEILNKGRDTALVAELLTAHVLLIAAVGQGDL